MFPLNHPVLSSNPAFQCGVTAPNLHFQGKFAAPNTFRCQVLLHLLCEALSYHSPLVRQTLHFLTAQMMKGYHILLKKPTPIIVDSRLHFMLTFISVREVYVAKDTVRESKTRATMSFIIWSITDCSGPATSALFLFLQACCETLPSYKYSPHSMSLWCQSR